MGVRLDVLKCLTLDALDSSLEKVYVRDTNVRRYIKTSRLGLDELVGLLRVMCLRIWWFRECICFIRVCRRCIAPGSGSRSRGQAEQDSESPARMRGPVDH